MINRKIMHSQVGTLCANIHAALIECAMITGTIEIVSCLSAGPSKWESENQTSGLDDEESSHRRRRTTEDKLKDFLTLLFL